MAQQQREEEEARKRERMEEEASLRDQLIKTVHQLEHRKLEIQRELVLRTLSSSSGVGGPQLRSAVVIPAEKRELKPSS